MPDDVILVYVTCADLDEARRIGRIVVEEGLAACANLRTHDAIYRWEGALVEEAEAELLLKTMRAAYPRLEARVTALHSYAVPCIVAWELTAGLPAYGAWVRDQIA